MRAGRTRPGSSLTNEREERSAVKERKRKIEPEVAREWNQRPARYACIVEPGLAKSKKPYGGVFLSSCLRYLHSSLLWETGFGKSELGNRAATIGAEKWISRHVQSLRRMI
jgi:hypothetical protein